LSEVAHVYAECIATVALNIVLDGSCQSTVEVSSQLESSISLGRTNVIPNEGSISDFALFNISTHLYSVSLYLCAQFGAKRIIVDIVKGDIGQKLSRSNWSIPLVVCAGSQIPVATILNITDLES